MTMRRSALVALLCALSTSAAFAQEPLVRYATYVGGPFNEMESRVAVGPDGAVFTAFTEETDFGHFARKVRVMKFAAGTRQVVYSVLIGGGRELAASIAVGPDGAAWVTGWTTSSDFPLVGAIQSGVNGEQKAFLFRLSPSGTLTFSTLFATGPGTSEGQEVVVDTDGSAVWSGTASSTVPVTPGVFQPAYGGGGDIFIARISAGGALLAATYLGGSGSESTSTVALGPDGDIYVAGSTHSPNMPTSPGAFQVSSGKQVCQDIRGAESCYDAFVGRFSPDLTRRRYLTYLRETDPANTLARSGELVSAMTIGPSGDAYVTGLTWSGNLFPTTPGVYRTLCDTCFLDAFSARLNSTGTALVYSTFVEGMEWGWAIALDPAGRVYVAGRSSSVSASPKSLVRFDPNATVLQASIAAGGYDIALDRNATLWLSSLTGSPTFPTTPDAWRRNLSGTFDATLVGVAVPDARLSIDLPGEGNVIAPFEIGGWAIDRGAPSDTGIDAVHVYAYPNPGSGAAPIFLGAAPLGFARPDVAAVYGAQFGNPGWLMKIDSLPVGPYLLVAFAHSQLTGSFDAMATRTITVVVDSRPLMSIDSPAPDSVVAAATRVFVGGWAIDQGAPAGTGIDAIHVWIYPNGGAGTPFFAGAANYGVSRADVGAVYGARFTNSGYELDVNGLTPGTYVVVAFAHSTVTNSFVVMQTRAVTISP